MEASQEATIRTVSSTQQLFLPKETLDHPFDVTLAIQDGKEFKVHRRVLSEASPFFERLLKSDMKESIEGVIHLEMTNEQCLGGYIGIYLHRPCSDFGCRRKWCSRLDHNVRLLGFTPSEDCCWKTFSEGLKDIKFCFILPVWREISM